jgi:hypothetical protein
MDAFTFNSERGRMVLSGPGDEYDLKMIHFSRVAITG